MAQDKNDIPTLGEITAHEQANINAFLDLLSTLAEIDFEAVRGVYQRASTLVTSTDDMKQIYNETLGTIEVIEGARRQIEANNS